MKLKRKKKGAVVSYTRRRCRECNKLLPPTRYFQCDKCQPVLGSVDDEMVYHGVAYGVGGNEGAYDSVFDALDTMPLIPNPDHYNNNFLFAGKKKK